MTNDIRLAFAHPSERAAATALDGDPLDRISLRDYVVEVEIGAFQLERGVTQRVQFNVVVEVARHAGPIGDDVDQILSYDRVTEAIDIELAAERLNLLETLAERVADRILGEPQARRVFVRIEKVDRGPYALGVEIVRALDQVDTTTAQEIAPVPHPRLVYVSNDAIASGFVPGWLDQLSQSGEPLILVVGAGNGDAPQVAQAPSQRRIDLLNIEQNAWVLAAQDPRCKVVDTRTELDWAMKNGQICVWAPSKMLLDAADGPSVDVNQPQDCVTWFAQHMQASDILVIGADWSEGSVAMRHITIQEAL